MERSKRVVGRGGRKGEEKTKKKEENAGGEGKKAGKPKERHPVREW